MFPGTGKDMTRLVLASGSPRRRELLRLLDLPFDITQPSAEEGEVRGSDVSRQAAALAQSKALSVAAQHPGEVIVAADTLVVLQGVVMGKPADAASAREMLESLRGQEHLVISGLAVVHPGSARSSMQAVETRVWMRDYEDREIAAYIARREPFDKAGAYAIQDQDFQPVARIEGCYANVMGLPLCHLFKTLSRADFPALVRPVSACENFTGHACSVASSILDARTH
jgi:septum formation protein